MVDVRDATRTAVDHHMVSNLESASEAVVDGLNSSSIVVRDGGVLAAAGQRGRGRRGGREAR